MGAGDLELGRVHLLQRSAACTIKRDRGNTNNHTHQTHKRSRKHQAGAGGTRGRQGLEDSTAAVQTPTCVRRKQDKTLHRGTGNMGNGGRGRGGEGGGGTPTVVLRSCLGPNNGRTLAYPRVSIVVVVEKLLLLLLFFFLLLPRDPPHMQYLFEKHKNLYGTDSNNGR